MFLLVLAYPGSPGHKAVKRLCVCVCVCDNSFHSLAGRSQGPYCLNACTRASIRSPLRAVYRPPLPGDKTDLEMFETKQSFPCLDIDFRRRTIIVGVCRLLSRRLRSLFADFPASISAKSHIRPDATRPDPTRRSSRVASAVTAVLTIGRNVSNVSSFESFLRRQS